MNENQNEFETIIEEWRKESSLSDVTKDELEKEALKQLDRAITCSAVIPSIWLYEKLEELEENFLQ